MQDFEKLGAFYLGRNYDLARSAPEDQLLLYDSKDLTTHAVIVGMTGSGKTGLALALLEEAAIDGIPAIAIDPKGDLGNLLLTFPSLDAAEFRPWIDESEALRRGMSPDQFAAETARRWREGLAEWGQGPQRVARFRQSVDMAIFTPGSSAGLELSVLRSFQAPPAAMLDDPDALHTKLTSAVSGLLALLGADTDPIRSREHILLSNIVQRAWQAGRSLDIAGLIHEIQSPEIEKLGVLDLETFFPARERMVLAMSLNNLLASPSFRRWMDGEPLAIDNLLYTPAGKPRLSIISIAHLSDAQRMFMVTMLLGELLSWMRTQSGTSSLRALLYMDEVFGYFPPIANPPSKTPMLTLLKQARAFGLGIILATQNPVDLDYKGLSNTGTWFLGRLQTERDKLRVLEGLEGASLEAGARFDRQQMEQTLARLGNRVFLMNNVHEDEPAVFQTRWTLSYLRGPLTGDQIHSLMSGVEREPGVAAAADEAEKVVPRETLATEAGQQCPMLPADIEQLILRPQPLPLEKANLVYRPALLGRAKLHFVKASCKLDTWESRAVLQLLREELPHEMWEGGSLASPQHWQFDTEPVPGASFGQLPAGLTRAANYPNWARQLRDYLYRTQTLQIWNSPALKRFSEPGESQAAFRIRLAQIARQRRDLEAEKLKSRYASKYASLRQRIRSAEEALDREKSQYQRASLDTAVSIGQSILGAFLGRKLARRTSSSIRSAGRTVQQRDDVGRAAEKLEALRQELAGLEKQFDEELKGIDETCQPDRLELVECPVRPRKSDIQTEPVALVWTPWKVDPAGLAEPAFALS